MSFLKFIVAFAAFAAPDYTAFAQGITFNYTGAIQTYMVPGDVTDVTIDLLGAGGGSSSFSRGGYGGRVQCHLAVTPGTILNIFIGGSGSDAKNNQVKGGFNGGGESGVFAGSGGGASDIRIGGIALSDRVVVAGGGGGAAANTAGKNFDNGGNGGGLTGENGYYFSNNVNVKGGGGGGVSAYTADSYQENYSTGKSGFKGDGYDGDASCGGGGGGYYGGAGGGAGFYGGGGGGGSSFANAKLASAVVHTQGYNTNAHGLMIVTPSFEKRDQQISAAVPGSAKNDKEHAAGTHVDFTGSMQKYIVPEGVTSIGIDLQGATGGSTGFSRGGYGGRIQCTLAVTPGSLLYFNIGGAGHNSKGLSARGGYNGGGGGENYAGGGGGASDIRYGGSALSDRVIVAGGGGGGAAVSANKNYDRGGDGGSPEGENGYSYAGNTDGKGGSGGSPSVKETFLTDRSSNREYSGGGGGGGYYSGGGGTCGGGGGSSFSDPALTSSVIHTRGYNTSGNGTLTFTPFYPSEEEKTDDDKSFTPHGKVYGQVFSDFAYKAHADTVLEGRSGISQYAKVPAGITMFQFRRVAVGYNYDITKKFSFQFLMAAEDDYNMPLYQSQGDLLSNSNFAPFIKLANMRWKNIFKGSDLVFGQLYTPAFHATSEDAWGYRSIARTLTHVYRTNEYDMGMSLQGHLPDNDNVGYNLMVGNGTGAMPESNSFKWFYGDVYHKFFNKKLLVDFYADYQKLTWTPTWHRDRQMNKITIAYTSPKITVGVEAFTNRLMGDNIATRTDGVTKDTLTTRRTAYSIFVHGKIYSGKLGFFARYDSYNWKADNNNKIFESYNAQTTIYDHNTLQEFVTFGLDYSPFKNVHVMPNIWYNYYQNVSPSSVGDNNRDFDLVCRLTLSYQFGM